MRDYGWIALAAVLFLGADEPAPDASAKDLKALQGTWQLVAFEVDGKAVEENQVKAGRAYIKGNRYIASMGSRETPFTIVLDATKMPKTLDMTFEEGQGKGRTLKAIYKLENDLFTMCRGGTARIERPVEFSTGAESGQALIVWRRVKGAN